MLPKKRIHPTEKSNLHPRNKHRERYDFKKLIASCPPLAQYVSLNKFKDESIDFFDPEAVKMLNKALLMHFYGMDNWNIPQHYLCPPIPGRADYIHYIADLLSAKNNGIVPIGNKIHCLDIGVGANCVYPIIGIHEYGWSFIGTDIDDVSIQSANQIIASNPILKGKAEIRLQANCDHIFIGMIKKGERFDISLCNPPFHTSLAEAKSGSVRKNSNLTRGKAIDPILNFGGQSNELWCMGGEELFICSMIKQSKQFSSSCFWFTTLVSKESSLCKIYETLRAVEAIEVKTIPMSQGNKISRIVAWTFLDSSQQKEWITTRWI